MKHDKENIMVILSSPSGVGKTTLTKKIQQKYKDYHFVSKEKFKELIDKGKFYEYAKIFENYYGTLKSIVDETIKENDILFDIDWQGTKQLSKFKNLNLIKIYLITEKKELKSRLIKRNQNTDEEVKKRFDSFDEDIKHWNDYDYIIINQHLENCFRQIENIIEINKTKNFSFQKTQ